MWFETDLTLVVLLSVDGNADFCIYAVFMLEEECIAV